MISQRFSQSSNDEDELFELETAFAIFIITLSAFLFINTFVHWGKILKGQLLSVLLASTEKKLLTFHHRNFNTSTQVYTQMRINYGGDVWSAYRESSKGCEMQRAVDLNS